MDKNKSMHLKYFIPINAPSDAPTPETDAHNLRWVTWAENGLGKRPRWDTFARRLERERDEARAELAKRSGDSHIDAPTSDDECRLNAEKRAHLLMCERYNTLQTVRMALEFKLSDAQRERDEARAELAKVKTPATPPPAPTQTTN